MQELIKQLEAEFGTDKNKWNWFAISIYQKLSEEFIREFQDKVDWNFISCYQRLSENIIRKFKDRVDWFYISIYQKLSEDFIREFQDKVHWNFISWYQKLSEEFIREFQDKVHWDSISWYQKLSEDFIREFQDKVDWYNISEYQKLSEDFIREFQDKVYWFYISRYQKLSEDFRKEFKLEVPTTCWLYKDIEFKREYVKNHTDYVLDGDYIIAYKSCRSDGYSKYNFQYHYEVGGTYESMADHNVDNENSFGLSAWSLEGAKEYCSKKVFKVKIHLDDIACFVHDNHKIRATKITILDEIL